jgi:hypothetical protein
MQVDLLVIAHIDLPGNYRLIRFKSAELCQLIQPGDVLHLAQLQHPLPYFRHSQTEEKVDFLFYLTAENRDIVTGKMLTATVQHFILPTKKSFRLLACQLFNLGKGLSIALDPILKTEVDLFVFEIDFASPFKLQPSQFYLPNMLHGVIANMTILEEANTVARFCSQANLPGCFDGTLAEFIKTIQINLPDSVVDYI